MGIKSIHLILIVLALLLSLGFGAWSLANGYQVMGWAAFICGAAVLTYGVNFIKKIKLI